MKSSPIYLATFALALILFSFVFYMNAWVADDAYITFRTVDNFANGRGLVWNVGERVQVYSHPFWMFIMSGLYSITHEVFYTSITLSFVLCIITFAIATRHFLGEGQEYWWKAPFFVWLFVNVKSVVDYSSSGLENPLSYALLALFYTIYLANREHEPRYDKNLLILVFVSSLAFFNRQDSIFLYLPALLHSAYEARRYMGLRFVGAVFSVGNTSLGMDSFYRRLLRFPLPKHSLCQTLFIMV